MPFGHLYRMLGSCFLVSHLHLGSSLMWNVTSNRPPTSSRRPEGRGVIRVLWLQQSASTQGLHQPLDDKLKHMAALGQGHCQGAGLCSPAGLPRAEFCYWVTVMALHPSCLPHNLEKHGPIYVHTYIHTHLCTYAQWVVGTDRGLPLAELLNKVVMQLRFHQ